MIWVRQGPFLFSPGLLFRWKTLWGPVQPGRALGPDLPQGPPTAPFPFLPVTSPPPRPPSCWLTVSQTSWPDAARGVPSSCFSHLPSWAAADAASRKQTPSKSRPGKWDPSRPSHPSGAGACYLTAALERRAAAGAHQGSERALSQVAGEPAMTDAAEATPHCSPCLGALWSCPSPGCQVTYCPLPANNSNFSARATPSIHIPQPDPLVGVGTREEPEPLGLTSLSCSMGSWEDWRRPYCQVLSTLPGTQEAHGPCPLWAAASSPPAPGSRARRQM